MLKQASYPQTPATSQIGHTVINISNCPLTTPLVKTLEKDILPHPWVNLRYGPNPSNKTLDSFQRAVKQDLLKSRPRKHRSQNLTKEERMGLNELNKNPDIILKKVDKGSAVAVTNITDYLREGYRQLSDTNFYRKLNEDPTQKFSQNIMEMRPQNDHRKEH